MSSGRKIPPSPPFPTSPSTRIFCTLKSQSLSLSTPFFPYPGALSHRAVRGLYHLTLKCNLADPNTPSSDTVHPCLDNLPKQTDRFPEDLDPSGSRSNRVIITRKTVTLQKETVRSGNPYVFPLIPVHTRSANIRFLIASYYYFVHIFVHCCKKQTLIL